MLNTVNYVRSVVGGLIGVAVSSVSLGISIGVNLGKKAATKATPVTEEVLPAGPITPEVHEFLLKTSKFTHTIVSIMPDIMDKQNFTDEQFSELVNMLAELNADFQRLGSLELTDSDLYILGKIAETLGHQRRTLQIIRESVVSE